MRHAPAPLVALLTAAVGVAAAPTRASSIDASPPDSHKKWAEQAITFFVCDAEPYASTHDLLLATSLAASTWNDTGAGPRIDVVGGGACADDIVNADGINHIAFHRAEWRWPETAGAATTVWRRSRVAPIADADIVINPALDWTLDAEEDGDRYDLWNVITHEMGHALGLPDVKDPRLATMFFMAVAGETLKRDLHDEDLGMLLSLYEDVADPSPGCASTPPLPPVVAALVLLALRRRRAPTSTVPARSTR